MNSSLRRLGVLALFLFAGCAGWRFERGLPKDVAGWFRVYRVLMDQNLPDGRNEAEYFLALTPGLQARYVAHFWEYRSLDPALKGRFTACLYRAERAFAGRQMTFPERVLVVCGWPEAAYRFVRSDQAEFWRLASPSGSDDPVGFQSSTVEVVLWQYFRDDGVPVFFFWTVTAGRWSPGTPCDFTVEQSSNAINAQAQFQDQADQVNFYYDRLHEFAMTLYGWDLWREEAKR